MKSSRNPAPLLLLACAFSLFGCATPKKEAEYDANGKKIEYVYYTPTGSNIPVKIRKDQLEPSDVDQENTQKALHDTQQRATKQDKPPGGS